MKTYERIRKILNSCGNSQMRDVEIAEIETGDIDADVKQFLGGADAHSEKYDDGRGTITFAISAGGLNQQISYSELP
jgi:hypothetical protein